MLQLDSSRQVDSPRQLDSPRQGVLENEASLCRDIPCMGGFETRPYEDHSGVTYPWDRGAPVRQIWDQDRSWNHRLFWDQDRQHVSEQPAAACLRTACGSMSST
ncbi:MAG: hypothetical protein NTV33_13430 [Coprothermobacterota bacterium]|nr:hypothetical protein [Coprothermobacterota bacterium]